MSDDFQTPVDATSESLQSAGSMLRTARVSKGLTLDDLASETRIARNVLEAMEADTDPAGQAPVFMRGFFRRCAKAVDLDESTLLAAYDARVGTVRPTLVLPKPDKRGSESFALDVLSSTGGSGWAIAAGIAVVICVLIFTVFLSDDPKITKQEQSNTSEAISLNSLHSGLGAKASNKPAQPAFRSPLQPNLPDTTAPQAEPTATAAVSPEAAMVSPTAGQPLATASTPTTAADSTAATTQVTTGATEPAASAPDNAPGQLVVTFTQDCWTSVTDDDGKRLLHGIFKAGERRSVSGKPPYRVVLGFGPGATVMYEGKPINFADQLQDGKTTARLTIPEED